MWVSGFDRCEIHGAKVKVTKDHNCGYHVFGKPHHARMHTPDGKGVDPVDAKFSGLELTPNGTSCDTCEYYVAKTKDKGDCKVVQAGGKLAVVEAMGCCARWEKKSEMRKGAARSFSV